MFSQADLLEASIHREYVLTCRRDNSFIDTVPLPRCGDLRLKITSLTEGEYAVAKKDVDRLRLELGQPPIPSLQSTLDERSSQ